MDIKSKFIRHVPCPDCGSSDAGALYENESMYCFSCGYSMQKYNEEETPTKTKETKLDKKLIQGSFGAWKSRGLDKETLKKYGVSFKTIAKGDKRIPFTAIFPYFNKDGKHLANKLRKLVDKKFGVQGDLTNSVLFGQQLFQPKGKYVTVTEGEIDAMSAYKMMGSKWPSVSIKNGALSATQNMQNTDIYDFLNSFDNIVLCFDNDAPGREAAINVARLFNNKKIKIVKLPHGLKDANDMLVQNRAKDFNDAWWAAENYKPQGVLLASDLRESIISFEPVKGIPYPWEELTHKTYGQRKSELVTWIAETGVGKTQLFREIQHNLLNETEENIGIFSIEETPRLSAQGILSISMNTRLHLPDALYDQEELEEKFDSLFGEDRAAFYDHFGSAEIDEVMDTLRYYTRVLNCSYIFIDHISMITSDQRHDDERKALDQLATKFKEMTMELDIGMHMIAHVNRQGSIRGTANIEKLSNLVIRAERDLKPIEPAFENKMELIVEKNRYTGDTGAAGWLEYDKVTGRLSTCEEPFSELE